MIQIDMPMPRCCDECFALDDNGDYPYCLISHDQRGYTFNVRNGRMPTCPLKEQEIAQAILLGEGESWGYWFKCSACGYDGIHESAKNFCQNCGKKLEAKHD